MNAKYTFIRHGEAGGAEQDEYRQLTEQGYEQAISRAAKMNGSRFDLVIFSSARRALQTVTCFDCNEIEKVELDELYFPPDETDSNALDDMLGKLGCDTLRTYINANRPLLARYASDASHAILQIVRERSAHNVLAVGHAVLLNAAAFALSMGDENILDYNLGECEGIYLDENGRSTYLQ